MSGFRMKGPRFALTSPENCRACIKCVYGNGEHAGWCEQRNEGLDEDRVIRRGYGATPRCAETPVQRETETRAGEC